MDAVLARGTTDCSLELEWLNWGAHEGEGEGWAGSSKAGLVLPFPGAFPSRLTTVEERSKPAAAGSLKEEKSGSSVVEVPLDEGNGSAWNAAIERRSGRAMQVSGSAMLAGGDSGTYSRARPGQWR